MIRLHKRVPIRNADVASRHSRSTVPVASWIMTALEPTARRETRRETRPDPGPATRSACPRCGGRRIIRWGRFETRRRPPRQRYRCADCGRTFSDRTATPLAHLKKSHLWDRFCVCVRASMTVRDTARWIGVHRDTAFRWRHRLLDGVRSGDYRVPGSPTPMPQLVAGPILLGEMWFLHSEKGKRPLGRPPRRNGWTVDWLRAPRAWVILAGDRNGHVWSDVVGMQRPDVADLERVLGPALDPLDGQAVLLTREGPYGMVNAFARRVGLRYQRLGRQPRDAPMPPDLGIYMRRLRRWLRPFCGVATRYLPNYLAWHRLVEPIAPQTMP